MREINFDRLSPPDNDFVNISAGFECVFIYAFFYLFLAVPSRRKCNYIEDDFFFKLE